MYLIVILNKTQEIYVLIDLQHVSIFRQEKESFLLISKCPESKCTYSLHLPCDCQCCPLLSGRGSAGQFRPW